MANQNPPVYRTSFTTEPTSNLDLNRAWYDRVTSQGRTGLTSHSRRSVKTSHFTPLIYFRRIRSGGETCCELQAGMPEAARGSREHWTSQGSHRLLGARWLEFCDQEAVFA